MRRIFIAALLVVALAAGCTRLPAPFGSENPEFVRPTSSSAAAGPQELNLGAAAAPTPRDSSAGSPPPKAAQLGAPTAGFAPRARQHITLVEPENGAMLVNATTVRGEVLAVPADKTLAYRVYDDHGRVIGRGPLAVTGDYGSPGTFEGTVNFAASPVGGSGQLEILDLSSPDGFVVDSTWINVGFGRRLAPYHGRTATISLNGHEPGSKFQRGDELHGTTTLTPPDNSLPYRVYDSNGNLVGSGLIKVQGEPGAPGRFAAPIAFRAQATDVGRIFVIDQSPADGRLITQAALNVMLVSKEAAPSSAGPVPPSPTGPLPAPTANGAAGRTGGPQPTQAPQIPGSALPAASPSMSGTVTHRTYVPGIVSDRAGAIITPQLSEPPLQAPQPAEPLAQRPQFSEPPAASPQANLAGRTWYLRALDGRSLLQDSTITMQLDQDGHLIGFAGCNRYFSRYTVAGHDMQIDAPGGGRKVCPLPAGVMQQENNYLFALAAIERYRLEGGELQLFTGDDLPALIFN